MRALIFFLLLCGGCVTTKVDLIPEDAGMPFNYDDQGSDQGPDRGD